MFEKERNTQDFSVTKGWFCFHSNTVQTTSKIKVLDIISMHRNPNIFQYLKKKKTGIKYRRFLVLCP